jgi:DNA polymerase-1
VLEVPEAEIDETAELVRDVMMNAYPLVIPLKVDLAVGDNWGEMK